MSGPRLFDRVKESSTTTGTGTLTLAGAVTGFRTFTSVLSNGDTTLYAAVDVDAGGGPKGDWEVGLGTFTTSGTTLARTTILASSNAGSAVSWAAGTRHVFIGVPADFANRFLHPTDLSANLTAFQAGRLLFPSDGIALPRDVGADLNSVWGPAFPFVDPQKQTWAWINQGTASITGVGQGLCLSDVGNSGTHIVRLRKKAKPTVPYTIDAYVSAVSDGGNTGSNSQLVFGVAWRQSSDGKLVTLGLIINHGGTPTNEVWIAKWTDANTFSASYRDTTISSFPNGVFMRLVDDNTNRKLYMSTNGQVWTIVHSVGRTDFLTADEVGFFLDPRGHDGQVTLHDWYEH